MFLRQSTAQAIRFGPCLDATDGVTEETALTIAQADMRLSKDGGAFAQKSAAGNATHDSDGWYSTTLSTTDTDTVGILKLNVHQPANMLPVWETFYVIEENVYDAWYGASGAAGTNLAAILTDTAEIGAAGAGLTEAGGTGDHLTAINLPDQTMNITGNLSGSVGSVTGNVGGTINGLTATALADMFDTNSGATYAGAVAGSVVKEIADNAGGSALTEAGIADAVWNEAQADHMAAGSFGQIASEIADILVDTAEIGTAGAGLTGVPWNAAWDAEVQSEVTDALNAYDPPTRAELTSDKNEIITDLDDIKGTGFVKDTHSLVDIEGYVDVLDDGTSGNVKIATDIAAVLVDTGTTLQAELDGIQADTEDIQNRLPAALVGGRMDSDMGAISTSTAAADALELSTEAIVSGTAQTGTLTTTAMTTDLTISAASQYNGRIIIFRSDTITAALRNQATDITSTTVANGELGFSALTTAPVNGDTFIIV